MTRAVLVLVLAAPLLLAATRYGMAEFGDIAFARTAPGTEDIPPAVFPHELHRAQFKCYACHEALFPLKAGTSEITMDAIQDDKFCGACHNGQTAFGVAFETCGRCHRP